MLKFLGLILKASFFTIVVLVAAHYITWDGKTVSDQVRSTLSHAEKLPPVRTLQRKSKAIVEDAEEAAARVGVKNSKSATTGATPARDESIPAEDRSSLQAVIHSSDAG